MMMMCTCVRVCVCVYLYPLPQLFNIATRHADLNKKLSIKRFWKRLKRVSIPLKIPQFIFLKWLRKFGKVFVWIGTPLVRGCIEFKNS
jgi:hypothetical protein